MEVKTFQSIVECPTLSLLSVGVSPANKVTRLRKLTSQAQKLKF